ncbi:MAG: transposase, partial [Ktedonobacteraceae bacterium]|nr:transposase [Ktedonobacteraceae bacterium]
MRKEYNYNKLFVLSEKENDPLESLVRRAAQTMLQEALEHEVEEFLARRPYQRTDAGQAFRGYRNGYAKGRAVTVGSGSLKVKVPRVSDTPEGAEAFASQLVKPYQKRSQTLSELFPKLFIEGLATRDFEPALRSLLGQDAPLSPSTISRLNQQFKQDFAAWRTARLDALEIVYVSVGL